MWRSRQSRLAAAAAAPSRERRPPALGRGRQTTPRASARVRSSRREPPLHKRRAPRARRAEQGAGSGFAGPSCRNGAKGPSKTGRTGRPREPESLRGPFRPSAALCPAAQQSGSVRHQPRSLRDSAAARQPIVTVRPRPLGLGGALEARHRASDRARD